MFVLFACGDAEVEGTPALVLDLRIISRNQNMIGGSWWVKREGEHGKLTTRADITKFLELKAKFQIADATRRGIDEIELIESSQEELAMAASFDDQLQSSLDAVRPTIFSKLARSFIRDLNVNRTGHDFMELPDWTARAEC